MDKDEMKRMLRAISDYLDRKDESPLAARDLARVVGELERLWEENDILISALKFFYYQSYAGEAYWPEMIKAKEKLRIFIEKNA